MIAGVIFVAGGLSATRFPADQAERMIHAHKTSAVSSFDGASDVVLLRPPTTLAINRFDSVQETKSAELPIESANVQNEENPPNEAPEDMTHLTVDTNVTPDKNAGDEFSEESPYLPFQGDDTIVSRAIINEFQSPGPFPPVIVPISIDQKDQTTHSHSLPPLKPIAIENPDATVSSLEELPVTAGVQKVNFSGSKVHSTGKNTITAQGSALVLPGNNFGRN